MSHLSRPLNPAAVSAADDQFYARHPELVQDGRRIPLDADDPDQARLRREWVALYRGHNGEPAPRARTRRVDSPTESCPHRGDLVVTVTNRDTNLPLEAATVEITGAGSHTGTTNGHGTVTFSNLDPGDWQVYTTRELFSYDQGDATVQANATSTAAFSLFPHPYRLTVAQWVDVQAYCGDEARLEAVVVGYPPNGPATVEILHPETGAVVETINANLNGGRIDARWRAKAQSARWRTHNIQFRVGVPSVGVNGTSTNTFSFRQRPTTGWILRDRDHATSDNFAPVIELHDARLEADQVHYSFKLRLYGAAFDAAKQTYAKSRIETIWNDGFRNRRFHRERCGRGNACDCAFDCCKLGFRLDANYVDRGEHLAIEIVVSPDPANPLLGFTSRHSSRWPDPALSPETMYAHEIGHALGQFDEYAGGAHDRDTPQVQPDASSTPNLMSANGSTVLEDRHYRWVRAFLNDNAAGDPYAIIPR